MRRNIRGHRQRAAILVFLGGLTIPLLSASPQAQDRPAYARLELGLWGGSVGARTLGSTVYQDAWTSFLGTSITEKTTIDVRTKNIPAFGTSLTYFFHPHTGIQLLASYAGSRTTSPALMDFSWTLADGSLVHRSAAPAVAEGRMTTVPICLNFVERLVLGRWRLEVSAGPAYFFHTLSQDSAFGYSLVEVNMEGGRHDLPPIESYDAISVPLRIPRTTWNAWGANLGAGLHFQAGPLLAFAAEARYFSSPEKSLRWTPQTGLYDGMFTSDFPAEPFGAEEVGFLAEIGQTFALKVKPSFFQVSLGVLLTFGR